LTLLNVCRAFLDTPLKQRAEWCAHNFVNMRSMRHCEDIHTQLRDHCVGMRLALTSCGDDTSAVRRSLVRWTSYALTAL
jgi:hypothetical protein